MQVQTLSHYQLWCCLCARHHTFACVWGEQSEQLQLALRAELAADADNGGGDEVLATTVHVLQCTPPFTSSAAAADAVAAGVCVFTPQSRDYSTWGPGVGEWFSGLEDTNALAARVIQWLGHSRRLGGGPQAMNTLGAAMNGCWRGRMGLEAESSKAVYHHFIRQ
jgi:hypothetical protein